MTENNFKIDSAAITDRGLSRKRPENEDSYLELNDCGLFAVADGVGGAQAGDVASQMAMEILDEAFANIKPSDDAEELMKIAIERANQAIYQMSRDLPQLATMATTIVSLHISGNIATIGHVGDSRLYMLDAEENLFRKTDDHSVVEEEVRAGRMTISQAATHPSRNIISRALGAESTVDVELKTIMFEPNTSFLLCSDGITRHIDDFELREFLISDESTSQICQRLKDLCYERGAEDNLTAVIARVSDVFARSGDESPVELNNSFEENTLASARTTIAGNAESPIILDLGEELPAEKQEIDESHELPPIELEVSEQVPIEGFDVEVDYRNEETIEYPPEEPERVNDRIVQYQETPSTVKEYGEISYDHVKPAEPAFLSKLLPGIFMLLIGMIVGAGAIYMLGQKDPAEKVQPPLQVKAENIALTEFEAARRGVDDDPEQYIKQLLALEIKDTEDFFLLGRAYMITGNYPEAKKYLEITRSKLGQADENNDTVMDNDIAAYLVIIENDKAQRRFSEAMKRINEEVPDANVPKTNGQN